MRLGQRRRAGTIALATLALLTVPAIAIARATSDNGPLFATEFLLNDCLDCEHAPNSDWCLWVRRPGRAFTQFRGDCKAAEPVVSPNGRWVVYERWRPASLVVRRLYRSPPRMGPRRVIARAPAPYPEFGPRFRYGWSADSRAIALMTVSDDLRVTLTIADRDGNRRRSQPCACPAVPPHPSAGAYEYLPASQLAWSVSGRIGFMQAGALTTVDTTGRDVRQLAGGEACGPSPATPAWSPNARKLLFACLHRLVSVDVAGGSRRTVFDIRRFPDPCLAPSSNVFFGALAWSPDGRSIAYGDHCDIVVMGADGARPRRLRVAEQQGGEVVNLTWVAARSR